MRAFLSRGALRSSLRNPLSASLTGPRPLLQATKRAAAEAAAAEEKKAEQLRTHAAVAFTPLGQLVTGRAKFAFEGDGAYGTLELYNAAQPDATPPALRQLAQHYRDLFCNSGRGGFAAPQEDGTVVVPQARNKYAGELSRIVLVKNELLETAFTTGLLLNERARTVGAGGGMHNPPNPDEFELEKEAARSVLKSKMMYGELLGFKKASVIPTFHGCSHEAADAICRSGMANAADADQNGIYFGGGLYTSTSGEYGSGFARSQVDGGFVEPGVGDPNPRPANPNGEHVVLMQLGNIRRAYVGTRGRDYPQHGAIISAQDPASFSFLHSESTGQVARAVQHGTLDQNYLVNVQTGYDSRYFIVNDAIGFQAVNLLGPTGKRNGPKLPAAYDELIFKESNQLCPQALFYIKRPPGGTGP